MSAGVSRDTLNVSMAYQTAKKCLNNALAAEKQVVVKAGMGVCLSLREGIKPILLGSQITNMFH